MAHFPWAARDLISWGFSSATWPRLKKEEGGERNEREREQERNKDLHIRPSIIQHLHVRISSEPLRADLIRPADRSTIVLELEIHLEIPLALEVCLEAPVLPRRRRRGGV